MDSSSTSDLWFPRVSVLGVRSNTVTFVVHGMAYGLMTMEWSLGLGNQLQYLLLQYVTIVSVVLYGGIKTYSSLLQSQS